MVLCNATKSKNHAMVLWCYAVLCSAVQITNGLLMDANAGLPGLYPGTRGATQPIKEIGPRFRLAFKQKDEDYISSSVYHTRAWT
jgi:hypothetical protein